MTRHTTHHGHHTHVHGDPAKPTSARKSPHTPQQHPADPTSQRAPEQPQADGTPIVVDGSNIAWLECSSDGKPKVANILKVRDALIAKGFAPVILCDAALYHQVDDPKLLNELIENQTVQQAPAQTDADYFVLETAARLGAQVVSDDQYKPYLQQYPWIPSRRVPVMIVEGMVELYREKLEPPEPPHHPAEPAAR